MTNDIFKKLDGVGKADFHDQAWLRRQEDKLRAHIAASPLPGPKPPIPAHLLIGAAVAAIIVGGAILLAHRSTPTSTPVPTSSSLPGTSPTPSSSPTPTPSLSPTASIEPTRTPEPTPKETKKPTPTSDRVFTPVP